MNLHDMNLLDWAFLVVAGGLTLVSLWPLCWTVLFLVRPCPTCHGLRRVSTTAARARDLSSWETVTCGTCRGRGFKLRRAS